MSTSTHAAAKNSGRLLGDTPERSYASKLEHFERFIAPDLSRIFATLELSQCSKVLDLGCGTGLATAALTEHAAADATVIGADLSMPHLQAARRTHELPLLQADMMHACFATRSLDFIWCCNTINHAADGAAVLRSLRESLKISGRIAIAQSGLLPEMFFAWDAHLDDAVRAACHSYYRDRYGLSCADTAALRGLVSLLRKSDYVGISVQTHSIERLQPLTPADRTYFQHAVFEGLWGEKIKPWLDPEDRRRLDENCNPASPRYCLNRDDFHHIQTLTVCIGRVPLTT